MTTTNSDISNGLDLKVVAKLFAESQSLKQFETLLNNPDSVFCNLDINGDGNVDYLRVVGVSEGDDRLIVLQAVLAPDIYQDVASIYVEKEEKTNSIAIQIIGDEYVYGTNYIVEPIYIYRPLIYNYLWAPSWVAYISPYYWDCYPYWWFTHRCWVHERYLNRCHCFHMYHHHHCSFKHGNEPHHKYYDMHRRASHREYADTHYKNSFVWRNIGMRNAHDFRRRNNLTKTQIRNYPIRQQGSKQLQYPVRQNYNRSTQNVGTRSQYQRNGSNTNTQRNGSVYGRTGRGSVNVNSHRQIQHYQSTSTRNNHYAGRSGNNTSSRSGSHSRTSNGNIRRR